MLLPTDVVDDYAVHSVFCNIFTLLQNAQILFEKQCEVLSFWCIASWFRDVLPAVPRFTITGPKYAADLLFRVLRWLCRRSVLLASLNPAVLKSIPISELTPTLFVLEPGSSKRATTLLDALAQKGYLVGIGGQMQDCYCPAIYLGEQPRKPAQEHSHSPGPQYSAAWRASSSGLARSSATESIFF